MYKTTDGGKTPVFRSLFTVARLLWLSSRALPRDFSERLQIAFGSARHVAENPAPRVMRRRVSSSGTPLCAKITPDVSSGSILASERRPSTTGSWIFSSRPSAQAIRSRLWRNRDAPAPASLPNVAFSSRHTESDHDMVGRFSMENPSVNIGSADLKTQPSPRRGTVEAICWQFYEELKARGLGGALFECFLTPASEHKVDIEHPIDSYLRWWKGYDSRVLLAVMMEMKPSESNRITLSENRRDVLGLPQAALSLQVSEHERRTLGRLRDLALTIFERLGRKTWSWRSNRSDGLITTWAPVEWDATKGQASSTNSSRSTEPGTFMWPEALLL